MTLSPARTPNVPLLDIVDDDAPVLARSHAALGSSTGDVGMKGKQRAVETDDKSDTGPDLESEDDDVEYDNDEDELLARHPTKFAQAVAIERPEWLTPDISPEISSVTSSSSSTALPAVPAVAPILAFTSVSAPRSAMRAATAISAMPAISTIRAVSVMPVMSGARTVFTTRAVSESTAPSLPIASALTALPTTSFPPTAPPALDIDPSLTSGFAVSAVNEVLVPSGDMQTAPVHWPAWTNVMDPAPGRRIGLSNQQAFVHRVLQGAISRIRDKVIFEDAFPDPNVLNSFAHAVLLDSAASLTLTAIIRTRMVEDPEYLIALRPIPKARVGILRTDLKKLSDASVSAMYHLGPAGPACMEIATMNLSNYNYIFPRVGQDGANSRVDRARPYFHPIGITLMRTFITGDFLQRNRDKFPSVMDPLSNTRVYEVPKAMLALVYTAVYASIYEYREGNQRKTDFTSDLFLDVYRGHIGSLENLEATRNLFYHTLMAGIYSYAMSTFPLISEITPILDISSIDFTSV